MTQLILDTGGVNVALPESIKNYRADKRALTVQLEMINGRLVAEKRGDIWVVSYQYGYLDDETGRKVVQACENGRAKPITCGFLPYESSAALTYSDFLVTSFGRPRFMWSRTGPDNFPVPVWADFSVELREVNPHA